MQRTTEVPKTLAGKDYFPRAKRIIKKWTRRQNRRGAVAQVIEQLTDEE